MTKIVWVSKKPLTTDNVEILKQAFGDDLKIIQIARIIDVNDVAEIIDYNGIDAKYIVLLPPHLIKQFLKYGVEVYRFISERQLTEDGRAILTQVGLERIHDIKYVTERIV